MMEKQDESEQAQRNLDSMAEKKMTYQVASQLPSSHWTIDTISR